jgi:hypothetical protein
MEVPDEVYKIDIPQVGPERCSFLPDIRTRRMRRFEFEFRRRRWWKHNAHNRHLGQQRLHSQRDDRRFFRNIFSHGHIEWLTCQRSKRNFHGTSIWSQRRLRR